MLCIFSWYAGANCLRGCLEELVAPFTRRVFSIGGYVSSCEMLRPTSPLSSACLTANSPRKIPARAAISQPLFAALLAATLALSSVRAFAFLTDEVPPPPSLAPVKIVEVAVNGGGDVSNPGTTCMKLDVAVQPACAGGWIAIKNNNGKLINAALQAKALANNVSVYYESDAPTQHCPNRVLTPCAVMSISVR